MLKNFLMNRKKASNMNQKINKMISAVLALFTAASLSAVAAAENTDSAGFAVESELAVPAKAPYDTKYVNIQWNTDEAETAGVPVAEGEHFLFPVGNKVKKLSEGNGELLGTAELNEKVAENCRGAALGGILVQPTRTSIYTINTADMSVVSSKGFGGSISTDVALDGNYAYFGVRFESGSSFYCVDFTQDCSVVWEYKSADSVTAATTSGGRIIFGAGTKLVVHEKDSGGCVETDIGAEITGAPFAGQYAVFLPAADGRVYKLRLNDDGTMEDDSLVYCEVGGNVSAPAVFNGRLYVTSDEGFFIIDSLNMEVVEKFTDMEGGSAPFVCYGNGPRVYIVAPMEEYWCLFTVYDPGEDNDPEATKLAKLDHYEGGRAAVSAEGTLCMRDGLGRLYALTVAEYSLFYIILKLALFLVLIVLIVLWLRFVIKKRVKDKSNFL